MGKRIEKRKIVNSSLGLKLDPEFLFLLDKHTWRISHKGYAYTFIMNKNTKLHHLIIGKPPAKLVTDHINRDKLDNRKDNLRFVTYSVSNRNRDRFNSTGYKYVSKAGNRFRGTLLVNGKTKSFRRWATAQEAHTEVINFINKEVF